MEMLSSITFTVQNKNQSAEETWAFFHFYISPNYTEDKWGGGGVVYALKSSLEFVKNSTTLACRLYLVLQLILIQVYGAQLQVWYPLISAATVTRVNAQGLTPKGMT